MQGLSKLIEFSKNIYFLEKNHIVSAGNLNVFFGSKLETKEGKHSLKQKSAGKPLEEEYVLCYLENTKSVKRSYTFRQNHSSDIINRRLGYIFISNKFKEFLNDTDIIPAFKTDHSPGLVAISNYNF